MIVGWTKPAADDLAHICDYTKNRFGPRKPDALRFPSTKRLMV